MDNSVKTSERKFATSILDNYQSEHENSALRDVTVHLTDALRLLLNESDNSPWSPELVQARDTAKWALKMAEAVRDAIGI